MTQQDQPGPDPIDYDVAIAGAGLTGRLMALALAQHGLKIAIFDPSPKGAGKDNRTTALAYASVRLFKRLGVWQPLAKTAAPINDILVSNGVAKDRFRPGGVSASALHFPSSILPAERTGDTSMPLGQIVENSAMNEAFEATVRCHDTIIRRYGEAVVSTQPAPGRHLVTTSKSDTVSAKLLIACDGKNSPIRKGMGLRYMTWGYGQKAIIVNMAHTQPHEGVAQELFYPTGPFAILPLNGNVSSIVWTEKDKIADAIMALPDDQFLQELRHRVGDYLGALSLASPRGSFPLSFGYAPTPVGERVALAGDAFHAVHPIAGQGFNLGIKDIAAMADVLGEAHNAGLDVGHGTVLDKYARWRRFDTAAMGFGMDAMVRLFSNTIAPIRWARSAGLGIVQKIDPARVLFMRQAGADVGDLPSLMQPL